MAKMLKILVVVLLLLSVAALVLGVLLFQRREVLKARAQTLEEATAKIAANLRHEEFNVADLHVERADQLPQMRPPLDRLAAHAANQYDTLQDTRRDLAATQARLQQTEQDLARTRSQLDATRQQVSNLEADLAARRTEIAQLNSRIDQLEQEKTALQATIEDLETTLARKDEENHDLRDQVVTLENVVRSLELELGATDRPDVPVGLSGSVALVSSQWNFVVLDIGHQEGLAVNAEMMVHRSDELIGKVRISEVQDHLSIAEILLDWQREPIQEGDHVLF